LEAAEKTMRALARMPMSADHCKSEDRSGKAEGDPGPRLLRSPLVRSLERRFLQLSKKPCYELLHLQDLQQLELELGEAHLLFQDTPDSVLEGEAADSLLTVGLRVAPVLEQEVGPN